MVKSLLFDGTIIGVDGNKRYIIPRGAKQATILDTQSGATTKADYQPVGFSGAKIQSPVETAETPKTVMAPNPVAEQTADAPQQNSAASVATKESRVKKSGKARLRFDLNVEGDDVGLNIPGFGG